LTAVAALGENPGAGPRAGDGRSRERKDSVEEQVHPLQSITRRFRESSCGAPAVLLVACVYLLCLLWVGDRGFWIEDEGAKFLQAEALARNGYVDAAVSWPGRRIDPQFALNPIPPPFSVIRDGRMYVQYPPLFALLSSWCFGALGWPGLRLLPLAGALALLCGVWRLGVLAGLRGSWTGGPVLICGLAMPVWFYSLTFWEHTLAAAFCVWSLVCCLRVARGDALRHLAVAGALAAAAIALRDDLYLLVPLILACAWFADPGRRLRATAVAALSLALALVPVWLLQAKLVGSPLGVHFASNLAGGASYLAERPRVLYNLFAAAGLPPVWSWGLAAPALILFVVRPAVGPRVFGRAVPALAAFGLGTGVLWLAGLLTAPSPAQRLYVSNSLFAGAPPLLLGLVRLRGADQGTIGGAAAGWLSRWAFLFSVLYALAAPEVSSHGMHWGTRFLFLVYPLFAVLITVNLEQWSRRQSASPPARRAAVALVAGVLALGVVAQAVSVDLLARKQRFSRAANAAALARPERALVTDVWWVPLTLYSVFFDRDCFYVQTREQLAELRRRLLATGEERYLFVTQAPAEKRGKAVAFVDDGGLGLFALTYFSLGTAVAPSTSGNVAGQ
jgi:hypothetical protein